MREWPGKWTGLISHDEMAQADDLPAWLRARLLAVSNGDADKVAVFKDGHLHAVMVSAEMFRELLHDRADARRRA